MANIALHIIDHAHVVHLGCNHNMLTETNDLTHHFNFSVDKAQLITQGFTTQEQIDTKMIEIFNDLSNTKFDYVESKGYDRKGNQRTRERTLDLSKSIIAYHNADFESKNGANLDVLESGKTYQFDTKSDKSVEPHFHIRMNDGDRDRGRDYVNLRNAVASVMSKHGVVVNFMEYASKTQRVQEDKLSRFSWALQKANNKDFKHFLVNESKLRENLDLLAKDAVNGNLQFYIKTMNQLQHRLNGVGVDFEYNDLNLRHEYAIPLSNRDIETIKIIESKNIEAINSVLNERDNKIARAFLEHSAGFDNVIIKELNARGYNLKPIELSKLDLTHAQKPELKQYFTQDRSTVEAQKTARTQSQTKKQALARAQNDLAEVLKLAKNEKELKELFAAKGYSNVTFSTKSKQRLGIKFADSNGQKHILSFKDTEFADFIAVRKQLEANSKTVSILAKGVEATGNEEIKAAKKKIFEAKQNYELAKNEFVANALNLRSSIGGTQQQALNVLSKQSTKSIDAYFLTGEGGAGKSYVTRQFIESEELNGRKVLKCGSTGIASCNIGGATAHSTFAIGICQSLDELKGFDAKNPKAIEKALKQIANSNVIIIDEISMLHKNQIELIDYRLKQANFKGKLVYVGDFLQLPPVDTQGNEIKFAFESKAWKKQAPQMLSLAGNQRSSNAEFTSMLNRIRYGERSSEIVDYLSTFSNNKVDEKEATYIFATSKEVAKHNALKLEELDGHKHTFKNNIKIDNIELGKDEKDKLFEQVPIDSKFECKVGAKVLLLANDKENNLFNGDRAVIESISKDSVTVKLESTNQTVEIKVKSYEVEHISNDGKSAKANIYGLPLRLSYGITAHKSQGLSLDHVVANAKNIFEDSQFYIALSRAKNPQTLRIDGTKEEIHKAIMSSTKALAFMHDLDLSKVNTSKEVLQNANTNLQEILQKEHGEIRTKDIGRHLQQTGPTASSIAQNSRDAKLTKSSIVKFVRDTCITVTEAILARLSDVRSIKDRSYRDALQARASAIATATANRERREIISGLDVQVARDFKDLNIDIKAHNVQMHNWQKSSELLKELQKSQQEIKPQQERQIR